ncbi:MAG TPA: PfkB family carbohydrate kinase, partial [Chitinophagaceae bacterium]|nr:PfkB family carbohydrate kinase [Chitinophagaceae bacterium]
KEAYLDHAKQTAGTIMKKFEKCVAVANTFRFDEGNGVRYYAALDHGGKQFVSPEFVTNEVVDRVGSGDCFMAGLIYGFYQKHKAQEIIDFAAAAAIGKLREKGDITSQSVENVHSILSRTWPKQKI